MICLALIILIGCENTETGSSAESVTDAGNSNSDAESSTVEEFSENPESDFEYKLNPAENGMIITKYVGASDHVAIPSTIEGLPVLAISSRVEDAAYVGAFQGSNIKSVVIPNSVLMIYSHAFSDCSELSQVSFDKASELHTIAGCFANCTSLERIDFSTTKLKYISDYTFHGCTSLKEINFCDSVSSIGKYAFYECSSLTELDLPENLEEIGEAAFMECKSLKTITVPQKLSLMNGTQYPIFIDYLNLEKIIFEEGREDIIGYGFFDTRTDVEIIIPKSVKEIEPKTFFIHGKAKIIFLGDCPKVHYSPEYIITPDGESSSPAEVDDIKFYGEPTIYYDPSTKGWDNCPWKGIHPIEPIE